MKSPTEPLLDFFKALADESRLKIVGTLAQQPRSVQELAALLELGSPTISHHLSKLQKAGLVRAEAQQAYSVYSLNPERLQHMSQSLLKPEAFSQMSDTLTDNADVLVAKLMHTSGRIRFYSTGHNLTLVMEWLRDKFEKDTRYTEPQVANLLETYCVHESTTVRRYMTDLKMLARKRDGSAYWRADSPLAQLPNFNPDALIQSTYSVPKPTGLAVQGHLRQGRVNLPSDDQEQTAPLQLVWQLMGHRFNKELAYTVAQVDAVIQHFFHNDPAEVRAVLLTHEYLAYDAKHNTFSLKNDTVQYDQKVLAGFLVDGRLKEIPAQRKKRQAVLRWLTHKFEWRKRYTEKQVNELLKQYHDDLASLRRYLIGEKFLDRKGGVYWRIK